MSNLATWCVDLAGRFGFTGCGDLAAWFEAVGTLLLFGIALYQIAVERRERHKRERRGQAELVSGWVAKEYDGGERETTRLAVFNGSKEPVYEVIATLVAVQGAGDPEGLGVSGEFRGLLSMVPPATKSYVEVAGGYRGMSFIPGVMVAFTDRAGLHWKRYADGRLIELRESQVDHFGLPRPLPWKVPEEESD